jgi:Ca2+-binding EF-hand superfamily protein
MRTVAIALVCVLFLGVPAFADDFKSIDKNKNGKVDLQEFLGFVKVIGPVKFKQYDADNDGFLSKKEFSGDGDFKKVDTDKNGKIDPQEFTVFLIAVIAPTKFKSYDMNRDGHLDEKEFKAEQKNPVELGSGKTKK